MRILHVLPILEPGGMERLIIQLAADATSRGDSVVVASAPGAWVHKVEETGATHVALPAASRGRTFGLATGTATATALLARCIRRVRPDVVHAHNVRATALARAAIVLSRHRTVLFPTLHGLAPSDYEGASRVLRRTAHRVIACAPSVARSLEAAGFPGDRIDVITNGAALRPAGARREADLRAALQLGSLPLVVGIGRLVEQKNWPVFIEAAGRVEGATFLVAGEGPLRPELTALSRRSGNRVQFLGMVDDIAALVGQASCVVSTSNWEGLPLTLLEALSLGAPVVATAVDGITDLVPPTAALLVPPGDPTAVAVAISKVLADDDLAKQLRDNALREAPSWSLDQMLDRYRNAYRAACAGEPRWA
jgi:glycosyltransferase involved in cell wall biosynthesis